jgi:hypothetical protein
MGVLTFFGRLLVAAALVALGLGLWLWLGGADVTQPAGQLWFSMDLESLNGAQVLIERHLHMPWLWQEAVVPLLKRPTWEAILWLVIGGLILGGLLLLGGRKPRGRSSFRS